MRCVAVGVAVGVAAGVVVCEVEEM